MRPRIVDAIAELRPNKGFSYTKEGVLTFSDSSVVNPSESEIKTKLTELQADYDAKKYQRNRASAFPSWQEQLDMQYWDKVNGTNNWQEAVTKVKTAHPKPE